MSHTKHNKLTFIVNYVYKIVYSSICLVHMDIERETTFGILNEDGTTCSKSSIKNNLNKWRKLDDVSYREKVFRRTIKKVLKEVNSCYLITQCKKEGNMDVLHDVFRCAFVLLDLLNSEGYPRIFMDVDRHQNDTLKKTMTSRKRDATKKNLIINPFKSTSSHTSPSLRLLRSRSTVLQSESIADITLIFENENGECEELETSSIEKKCDLPCCVVDTVVKSMMNIKGRFEDSVPTNKKKTLDNYIKKITNVLMNKEKTKDCTRKDDDEDDEEEEGDDEEEEGDDEEEDGDDEEEEEGDDEEEGDEEEKRRFGGTSSLKKKAVALKKKKAAASLKKKKAAASLKKKAAALKKKKVSASRKKNVGSKKKDAASRKKKKASK